MNDKVDDLVKTICLFNIEGWGDLKSEQVKVTRIGDGYINTTSKIERTETEKEEKAPRLIHKIYGGNLMFDALAETTQINSPLVQSLIAFELSRREWGPKVYGLTEEPPGRLEEFIDCHTLGQGEAFEGEDLSADLAKALARFHSLDLPFVRGEACPLVSSYGNFIACQDKLMEWLEVNKDCEHREHLVALSKFPLREEVDWFMKCCKKISHRVVLASVDCNYLNRLVREQKPSHPEQTRCLIIDFDLASYSHRGVDLGSHFTNRLFNWKSDRNKVSGYNFPSPSERKHFIEAYLDECKILFDDFDEKSTDSLEQVTMEADIYSGASLLWLLSFFSDPGKTYWLEPQMVTSIKCAIENYNTIKYECRKKYPQFADD